MPAAYHVHAIWDDDAKVWCSQSNIPGLVIEADTLAEFESLMVQLAPEILAENANIHNTRVPVDFRFSGTREFAVA